MMMFAQHGRGMDMIVDEQPQLAAGFQSDRLHVYAFVREETADARQRARAVGQAERQLNTNHGGDNCTDKDTEENKGRRGKDRGNKAKGTRGARCSPLCPLSTSVSLAASETSLKRGP
jgi:hypothetical protein